MDLTDLLVIALGALIAAPAMTGLGATERRYATLAFVAHIAASFAFWILAELVYTAADATLYLDVGSQLVRFLDMDFGRFAPALLKLALHTVGALPIPVTGEGSSTGTMCAVSGFLSYLFHPSLLTFCLASTVASWFGQVCLYRVARRELAESDQQPALLALLFVPTVTFWGGGFAKEALVMAFFGPLVLSSYHLLRGRDVRYLPVVAVAGVGVAMLKAYTLLAYLLAVAAAIYSERGFRGGGPIRLRPGQLVLAGIVALGGLLAMGKVFPEYEVTQIAETVGRQQQAWVGHEGFGSNIQVLGGAEARSIPQQVAFVPIALVNALLRPSLFDVRNGPTLMAAVENTLIALGFFNLIRSSSRGAIVEGLLRTPLLVFSVTFVLVFGIGIGLTTSNLGSISRYRAPMMPFYVATLLVLRDRLRRQRAAVTPKLSFVGGTRPRARAFPTSPAR
jgi:hypothetical protein